MNLGRSRLPLRMELLVLAACAFAVADARPIEIPPHHRAVALFSNPDPRTFDTVLKSTGIDSDPTHVFRIERGVVHISGAEMGYIITKQSFHDYYLRAQFKWGQRGYAVRAGKARNSGIHYNVQGDLKVWPEAIEFQIAEGSTGDFRVNGGAALTARDGVRHTSGKIDRFGKGPSKNVTGYRDPVGEVEKPYGKWNTLELIARGNDVKQFVNGKLVNEGSDPFPKEGKILLQSEGAGIDFRGVKLYPLK